jgi:nucleoside-diphosphate kinase
MDMIERTLVIVKPDGVARNLTGGILARYEKEGFKLKALKMMKASRELIKKHYPESMAESLGKKSRDAGDTSVTDLAEQGRKILEWLRTYLTEGPVVVMLLEGPNVIERVREIAGYTDPSQAKAGTIRGDFGTDSILKANREQRSVRNILHASGNREEAEKEIQLWLKPEEIME